MSKVADGITAGLREAIAIAKGRAEPARLSVPPVVDYEAQRGRVTRVRPSDDPAPTDPHTAVTRAR